MHRNAVAWNGDVKMAKKKYDFDYSASSARGMTDIAIFKGTFAYVSKKAIKRFPALLTEKWRWGEDKANGVVALKKDENGHSVVQRKMRCEIYCPADIQKRYDGKYALEEEDDVLVLTPL